MKLTAQIAFSGLIVLCFFPASTFAQSAQTPAQRQQPEFIKQGQQLMREGKLEEALALYRQTLQAQPLSLAANVAAGNVLDLMGKGEDARKYFQKAIDIAEKPEQKASANRAMAMSYAFEGSCKKTVEYEQKVLDYFAAMKDFFQQGEIADEAARVCIDDGDLDTALHWYKVGHDTGLKEPDIKPARVDLWNFRWEHAQARLAARRGDIAAAQEHVTAAKAILDKGTNPEQAQFFPYLQGYVALYGQDYKTAAEELLKANQNDPFIQCLLGQTYEELGERDKAIESYRKAAAALAHNPPAAYAVPFAKKKLASFKGLASLAAVCSFGWCFSTHSRTAMSTATLLSGRSSTTL
ncbi:MAG TPA: tetratricopeptide repeat protein [Candidatus Acidoferrum sp.]